MQKLYPEHYEQISSRLQRHGDIIAAYSFGSQTRDECPAPRDVDIAILSRRRIGLEDLLLLRREISLALKTDRLDVIDLRAAGPVLKRNVVASQSRFYCRDEHDANQFELQALAEYRDSAYRRRVQSEMLRRTLSRSS